jgi:hypothetical protein
MLSLISGNQSPTLIARYANLSDEKLDRIEDIADHALSGTVKSSALPLVAGLGIGGSVAAFSGIPIIGALAASYFIYSAISSTLAKGKQAQYIKDHGILAHCLGTNDLIKYIEIIGTDAAMIELHQARRDGEPISPAARRFAKSLGKDLPKVTIESFVAELKALEAAAAQQAAIAPAAAQQQAAIGAAVPSGNVNDQWQQPAPETALEVILASPLQSRFFIGAQRTGKSYLAAVATQRMQNTAVYHINLASYGEEDEKYWGHAIESTRGDLATMVSESAVRALLDAAMGTVSKFVNHLGSPAILVVDEFAFVGSKFGRWAKAVEQFMGIIANQIAALSSTGEKRQKAIYALAPTFTAGGVEQAAKAVKDLQLCYLAIHKERTVQWLTSRISFNEELHERIKANWKVADFDLDLDADRCCYIQGQWRAVGKLPELAPAYTVVTDGPADMDVVYTSSGGTESWYGGPRQPAGTGYIAETPGTIRADGSKVPIGEDLDARIEEWVLNKLSRFPDGLTVGMMWNQAPKWMVDEAAKDRLSNVLAGLVSLNKLSEVDDRFFDSRN